MASSAPAVIIPLYDPCAIHADGTDPLTANWNAGSYEITMGSLVVDTDSLIVDAVNHRVGIRTATPSNPLHVPWISGDSLSTAVFGSSNASNNQTAIQANSYSDFAIGGISNSGVGVSGVSTSSVGVRGTSTTGLAFEGFINPVSRDSLDAIMNLYRRTSQAALNNIGGSIDFYLENDAGEDELAGRIGTVLYDVSDGDEEAELVFYTEKGGLAPTMDAKIKDGSLQLLTGDIGLFTDPDLLSMAANALTVNGTISTSSAITGGSFVASGDVDTQITFPAADQLQIAAGGIPFIKLIELGAVNFLLINDTQADMDFAVATTGSTITFVVNGETDRVGIKTSTPDTVLQIVGDLKVGDDNTNYASFATDGELTLTGTARVTKELTFKAQAAAKGASAPTDALRTMGASGTLKFPVSQFSKTTQQDIHGEFHLPDDVDNSVNIEFHLMWIPGSGWTTGNYVWKLEYLVKEEDDDTTTGTPTTISMDVTPSNATDIIETEFTSTIDANAEQIVFGHFYRDVANDNGDDTGDIIFFEVKYTSNKLGEAT